MLFITVYFYCSIALLFCKSKHEYFLYIIINMNFVIIFVLWQHVILYCWSVDCLALLLKIQHQTFMLKKEYSCKIIFLYNYLIILLLFFLLFVRTRLYLSLFIHFFYWKKIKLIPFQTKLSNQQAFKKKKRLFK